MKDRNVVALMDESANTVKVVFPEGNNSKRYTFLTDQPFEVGDHAVVESWYTSSGMAIVEVVEVDDVPDIDPEANYEYRWLVQRVDKETHREREQRMKQATEQMRTVRRRSQREQVRDHVRQAFAHSDEGMRGLNELLNYLNPPKEADTHGADAPRPDESSSS